jgi:4-hydroxyphenylpyruvate dioxygenase
LDALKNSKIELLTPPPHTYYEDLTNRLPQITENITELEQRSILLDGDEQGYLLQVFTKNLIGPIFVEIIQRKNHGGFGEGNFQALFDAIERDQENRGYLK